MIFHHKLSIFRGRLTFASNTQKIWGVLIFLSIVTVVEVALGIFKPTILMSYFLGMKLLNWIFIILTIVKAVTGLRVDKEEEINGLDLSEHGMEAYADFRINGS